MLVKIHKSYRYVVSICDSDLINKKLQDEKLQLDLTGAFFKGEEKTKQETIDIIEDMRREDATFNIVGKESCNLALELSLIKSEGITHINDVPVSLVLL